MWAHVYFVAARGLQSPSGERIRETHAFLQTMQEFSTRPGQGRCNSRERWVTSCCSIAGFGAGHYSPDGKESKCCIAGRPCGDLGFSEHFAPFRANVGLFCVKAVVGPTCETEM